MPARTLRAAVYCTALEISGVARNLLRGDKRGSLGDGSPQRGPAVEYGNPREHQRGRDKNWPTDVTGDMGACPHLLRPCSR